MEKIKEIQRLLKIYESLPKIKYEPTYLDICNYSGRRFEDICSRILVFYFQPKNEHGLKTLLLESLFESINILQENIYGNIQVNREENADGKRLDILVKHNDWVIGIENKIWANVYNPLEEYGKRIEQYDKQKNYKIILTLRDINNKEESKRIKDNGFIILSYTSFFESIKKRIGEFIPYGNMKYILYFYDFIQTLENMKGNNIMNKEMDEFFAKNIEKLDKLLIDFNEYKRKIHQIQIDKIYDLRLRINEKCPSIEWKVCNESDLFMYKNSHDIGVYSYFIENENDPIAKFRIKFTSWKNEFWIQYGEQIMKLYPNGELEIRDNQTDYIVKEIDGHDDDEIIKRLEEYCDCIINLK